MLHSDDEAKSPKYGDELSDAGCFFVTTMSFTLKLIFGLFFGGSKYQLNLLNDSMSRSSDSNSLRLTDWFGTNTLSVG